MLNAIDIDLIKGLGFVRMIQFMYINNMAYGYAMAFIYMQIWFIDVISLMSMMRNINMIGYGLYRHGMTYMYDMACNLMWLIDMSNNLQTCWSTYRYDINMNYIYSS